MQKTKFWGKKSLLGFLSLAFSLAMLLITQTAKPALAAAGTNQQLSFTGKIVKSDGTNIADGTYNMEFKIYQDGNSSGSGSTLMWTEDYLVSGSTGMPSTGGVTLTSGTFQVNLGSICALGGGTCGAKTNTGVDFNQQTLWLSMQIGNSSSCTVTSSTTSFNTACGGDGEMTPYIRLTAVPQALNADKLDGLDSTGFIQNSTNLQASSNFHISGTGKSDTQFDAPAFDAQSAAGVLGLGSTNAGVITLGNAANSSLVVNLAGSATAAQVKNQNGTVLASVDTTKITANNLVADSGFESALSNWSALNSGTPSQSAAQVYDGSDSLLIATGTNASGGGASYSTGSSFLSSATTYTLSAYVKTDSNLLVSTFEMGHMDNGSTTTNCLTGQTLPVNGGWQRFTCTFTTGTVSGSPAIYFKQTDTVNRNFYIDDLELTTDANADPSYQNGAISFTGTVINGAVVLQNASNSTNALQVENSSGNTIFNVDTTDTNLVSNPGFETNQTGWSALASTTVRRDSTKAYLGNYSLQVTIAGSTTGGAEFTLNPVVTALSTQYTISFFAILGSGTAPTLQAVYDPTGANPGVCSPTGTIVTGGWMRLSCTFAADGTHAPTTGGFLKIDQTNSNSSTWYIDAVQLEAATSASAYGAGTVSLNGVITSPVVFKAPAATTALQIQNASGVNQLVVDTVNNDVIIGASTKLQFANATNTNTISIVSGPIAGSITVVLPATTPGASTQQGSTNLPFVVNLNADSAALSSTTLADITASGNANDALSLVIPAGATVKFNAQIVYVSSSTSNAAIIGWKCSNASQASTAAAILTTTASAVINGGTATACGTTAANIVAGSTAGVTTPQLVTVTGAVKANAGGTTTLTFEYARSGSTGSTTIKAGSNVTWWQ